MESRTIAYDDVEELRSILVGQKITSITETTGAALAREENRRLGRAPDSYYYGRPGVYDRVLEYRLSNGTTLRAHARDGGCACSNGCFSVDIDDETRDKLIGATIMNVETEERTLEYDYTAYRDIEKVIVNGEGTGPRDGRATIRIFVYTDLDGEDNGKLTLVESSGGDNGYYGWGFNLSVSNVIVIEESEHNHMMGHTCWCGHTTPSRAVLS